MLQRLAGADAFADRPHLRELPGRTPHGSGRRTAANTNDRPIDSFASAGSMWCTRMAVKEVKSPPAEQQDQRDPAVDDAPRQVCHERRRQTSLTTSRNGGEIKTA